MRSSTVVPKISPGIRAFSAAYWIMPSRPSLTAEEISRLAFALYPSVVRRKLDANSTETLAKRIKDLEKGLLPEDEFAATTCWLGNCAGIHRIDQTPMPLLVDTGKMQAPDFLIFPVVDGNALPMLVEVKSTTKSHIKWSEKYFASLRRFADRLKLPLLLAWKFGDLWVLVDFEHFEKSVQGYRIDFVKAAVQDLSSFLLHNVRIQMNPAVEMRLEMSILDEVVGGTDTLLPEGSFRMRIDKAGFFRKGSPIKLPNPMYLQLFISTPDEPDLMRTGKQTCVQILRPLESFGFSLSRVLTTQLFLRARGQSIDWHELVQHGDYPSSGGELRGILQEAITDGFVRYVFDVIPQTWPSFLPEPSFKKRS